MPYLFHILSMNGNMFLPIYFFVLICAYKYGWKLGLLVALASPIVNYLATGMPSITILWTVLLKGVALAIIASIVAIGTKKISFTNMAIIVACYQVIGVVVVLAITGNVLLATSDVIIGYLGLIMELIFGYLVLYLLTTHRKTDVVVN